MRKEFWIKVLTVFVPAMLCACGHANQLKEMKAAENAVQMQKFVQDISAYAREIRPDFIIIPQNGAELAFNEAEPDYGILDSYIAAIDGIGNEELFYDGGPEVDHYRLNMLRTLKNFVKIMVSDFVSDDANLSDSISRSLNEGFIAFPRSGDNHDYKNIPSAVTGANENDIDSLDDARNFLYMINPAHFAAKQAMLDAIAATNYDVVLIDLFFKGNILAESDIERLKAKNNGKRRLVISYMNIGSAEMFRYYWRQEWKKGSPSWIKKEYDGYPDEYYVEYWHPQWRDIIFSGDNSYLKKIIDAGFDGAYLDNVEAYYFLVFKE